MKTFFLTGAALLIVSYAQSQDVQFPRQLTNEGSVLTTYQPQVESWDQNKTLNCRMAFSLVPNGGKEVLGVLYMKASTDVNMDNHRVLIYNMTVSDTHFPSLDDETAAKMGDIVKLFITSDRSLVMSLEQVVACTPKKDPTSTITVNNDPPVIFMSKRPTILLSVEGTPVKAAASKENIDYIVNANYPLFFDVTGNTWYLYDGLEWQSGKEASGQWSFTGSLPKSLVNLAGDTNWASLKGTVPAVSRADSKMPQVFYSDKLAELILFDGEPAYNSISGTSLKYATNSYSDIFFCEADKQYYYVTSGRWFRSANLNGPWTFATQSLPADFSKIPNNSPASAILSFVPGTEQAKDAVMIAQIPTTQEVDAVEAARQVHIVYSGDPQFKPIDNTTLFYAVNTTDKVIEVSSDSYYACVQGIWFVAPTPNGTWQTATSVPQSIYAMPTSSPVYNVTYVTQTVTTTNVVQSSYTSGYMGVYVVAAPAGVIIISGTGYYHPPYYYYPPYGYPVYYPYPVTYGMYAYHPYAYGGVAYHASYNPNTGMYARSATAYSPYGKATVAQGYNPSTGTYARGASVSTPYGTKSAAQAYNPYTGASASTRQNSNANGQWGSSTISKNGQTAQAGHVSTSQGTAAGVKTSNGDMYAGANGNVYKNTGNGWESAASGQPRTTGANANGSLQNNAGAKQGAMQQPAGGAGGFNTQDLNKDMEDRQRGNTQTQQFSGRGGGGFGGGFGGGGGRGRRG
jgi:hypothetical protein